jgi:hypothetical protein
MNKFTPKTTRKAPSAPVKVKAPETENPVPQVPSAHPKIDFNPSEAKRRGFRGEATHSPEEAAREMIPGGEFRNPTANKKDTP